MDSADTIRITSPRIHVTSPPFYEREMDFVPNRDISLTFMVSITASYATDQRAQTHLRLTRDFLHRLLRSVARDEADAERIDPMTAVRAAELVCKMGSLAQEPFVAPGDGSLLLEWELGDDRSIEIYIDNGTDQPDVAVVACGNDVREVPLSAPSELLSLLAGDSEPPGR